MYTWEMVKNTKTSPKYKFNLPTSTRLAKSGKMCGQNDDIACQNSRSTTRQWVVIWNGGDFGRRTSALNVSNITRLGTMSSNARTPSRHHMPSSIWKIDHPTGWNQVSSTNTASPIDVFELVDRRKRYRCHQIHLTDPTCDWPTAMLRMGSIWARSYSH
jgi:hypothetical protein